MSDLFYKAFEDRYRGSRETITARLRAYAPFIEPLARQYRPARALDVGCGRGEWLELAASIGFEAFGVDLDDGMLAECRARGLDVRTADAIATLRDMEPDSLAMVSAFHVVEHIPFDAVRTLIAEALRALKPGGLLILETPNPENLVVGASSFYRDPSHEKPIPPELLAFAAEHAGFARQLVVRLQEAPALVDAKDVHLQQVLDGVSPDYAVVAQKAGPQDVTAPLDEAFGRRYGLSLEVLAQRYDQAQVDRRLNLQGTLEHLQGLAAQGRAQDDALRASLSDLGRHMESAISRINAMEGRLAAAEAHADAMSRKVVDLLESTSWRVTAPLRYAGGIYLRVRNEVHEAQRNGTLQAALRRRAVGALKGPLLEAGRLVLRNPRAKRTARAVLARFPGLQARLREMMYQAPVAAGAGAPPPAGQQPDELSPRARKLYGALKQAQATRKD